MEEILNQNALAVLSVLQSNKNHPTAIEVYEEVKRARPRIGLATVYRILHQLAGEGLIKEIGNDTEGCRYDAHVQRHDHAICTACGALLDISSDIPVADDDLQTAAQSVGINVASYEIRIYGHCISCQRRD